MALRLKKKNHSTECENLNREIQGPKMNCNTKQNAEGIENMSGVYLIVLALIKLKQLQFF